MIVSFLSPVVCRGALVLFTLCSGRFYLQLFVGGLLSYLRYVRFVFQLEVKTTESNVNKTRSLLQTTGGKDNPNIT
jgi:hypothetical protein